MKKPNDLETSGASNPVSFPGFHPDVHPRTDRTRGFPPTLLIAIASLILALLFSLPAEASQERQTGGWLIDSQTRVVTSTDFIKTYRLSAQKITGYDFEGTPIAKNIAEVHVPFDPQLTALGLRHCKSEPSSNGIAAVYSVEKNLVKYAWIFDGKAFNKIPTSKVSCNRALLLD